MDSATTPAIVSTTRINATALGALERLAWTRFQAWRLDEADALARRVITFDPARHWPHYLRGEIATRRKDWSAALSHYEGAIELGHDEPETLIRASQAAWRLGQTERARFYIERALEHRSLPQARRRSIESFARHVGAAHSTRA